MRITDINLKHYYAKYYLVRTTEDGAIHFKAFETASALKFYCNNIFKEDFKTIKSLYDFVRLYNPLGDFEIFHANDILKMTEFILNHDGITDDLKLTALKELF